MIVLSIIFVIIILYSISFLLTLLIYKKGFGYRFELNPYIKYYHEKEFDCISGLSDHTMGYSVAIASVAKGAKMIEKHMTLKRADGGADSAFSMEPEEFKAMVEGVRQVEKAIGKAGYDLSEKQIKEREHTRSLFVTNDIKKGDFFTPDNMRSIRPGYGLHTKYYEEILGKRATMDLEKGTPMEWIFVEGLEDRTTNDCPAKG